MALLPPIIAELRMEAGKFHSEIDKARGEVQQLANDGAGHFEKLKAAAGPAMLAVGGAMTGAGVALEHLSSSLESAGAKLKVAIQNSGASLEEYEKQISATDKQMEKWGHTNADTEEALANLTTALGDPAAALDKMQLVANLATYKHISLAEAATMVAKAHGGSARLFKEFGIVVSENAQGTKDYDAALTALGEKLQGQASEHAATFAGHLEGLRARIQDVAAHIGEKLAPVLVTAGPLLMGLGTIITSGVIPALWGMATATLSAIAPYLAIAVAVAAVGVALYEIYTHWSEIWGFIKDIASDAWQWIKRHMDLIIEIALGPLGIAVVELKDHWDQVWGAIRRVTQGAYDDVIHPVIGFIADRVDDVHVAIALLGSGWDTIWYGIKRVVSEVWDFLRPIFDTIKQAVDDITGGIGAVANVAGKVGGAVGKVGHILGFAEGGVVPGPVGAPMLAVVHGGEYIMSNDDQRRVTLTGSRGGGGDTYYDVNVNVGPTADVTEVGRQIVSAIRQYERANGASWRQQVAS